jgi:hypothetical protein
MNRPATKSKAVVSHSRGQLVKNASFESEGAGWSFNQGVDFVFSAEETAHQGVFSARLGHQARNALLSQNVPGIKPGRFYQLNFYAAGASSFSNTPVFVRLTFFDKQKKPIGGQAIDILIEQMTLGDNYSGFMNFTAWPAPLGVHWAHIEFALEIQGSRNNEHIRIDDVTLVAV